MNSIYFEPPDHWTRAPIKALVDGPDNGAWGDEPGIGDIDVVCARVADFEWEHLTVNLSNPTIRSIKRNQFNRLALRNGDLLIEKSGGGEKTPVGRVVAFSGDVDAITSNFVARMRPKPGLSPDFLKYLFAAHYLSGFTYQFIKQATGIQNLDDKPLMQVVAWVPDPENQDTIAHFLDRETGRIDGLIEKKTRFIALLKEKEKAEISRLVRRGLDRSAPTTDSGVDWRGLVPAHWIRGRIKDHFRQEKRQGYANLTVLSVYREFGVIEKSSRDDNINKTPEDLTKYQLVNPKDLVINKMKAWQGSMGIAPMTGITSPDYVVMRPIGEHDPWYMHHYLRAQPMPWVYRLISNGIRTDQWRMEPEKFLGLPVFMPPIEEQRRIADRIDVELERIRGLIALTERSIDLLREKRASLITAAVTGRIDVRAAA